MMRSANALLTLSLVECVTASSRCIEPSANIIPLHSFFNVELESPDVVIFEHFVQVFKKICAEQNQTVTKLFDVHQK
jgi:hypothetical protein